MRSLLARLAVLGAFAVAMTACSNGSGSSLPFAGPPNNGGGNSGTFQSGSNGQLLLRFLQGSPDAGTAPSGTVDVCIDQSPFAGTGGPYAYGSFGTGTAAIGTLMSVPGGISHTIAVYNAPAAGATPGQECATAPGPFFGAAPIAFATLTPGNNVRWTVVLGGTVASGTRGLYVFGEPTFPVPPGGSAAISHNAAPAFSKAAATGVGFGICTTTVAPCTVPTALTGATNRPAPSPATTAQTTVINGSVTSPLASIPAGFYDGTGVPAGTPVPITSVAAPAPVPGQAYVQQLYAIDAVAGGLNLVVTPESTTGFGF